MSFSRWKTDRLWCGYGCEDTWQATFASFYCINFSSYHYRLVLTLIVNLFFVLSISYNMHKETGISLFSISRRSTFPSTSMIGLKNMVFTFSFMSEFIAWWWKQPSMNMSLSVHRKLNVIFCLDQGCQTQLHRGPKLRLQFRLRTQCCHTLITPKPHPNNWIFGKVRTEYSNS